MSSFTSEADRNRVVVCCCTTNVPACRSNTAMPAVIPAGTTTGADATADGDGLGEAGAAELAAGDGADGAGSDQAAAGAGAWQPASSASSASSAPAAASAPNLMARSFQYGLNRCRSAPY